MAAQLTYNQNGIAQIFSVRLTPWHNEGHILPHAPAYKDAIRLLQFDYPMEKRPAYRKLASGEMVPSDDTFFIVRTDTDITFGSVGSSYEIVSNEQAFAPLEPLVDSGLLTLETGGILRGGADTWLMGRWNLERFGELAREVFAGEVIPYATIMANHSGRRGILMGQTPVRIVCANTMGAAETSGQSRWTQIDHRAGANVRLVEAAQAMFGSVVERYEIIAQHYRRMMQTALTHEQFRTMVLDLVVPDPRLARGWNPEARMADAVVARYEAKANEIKRLWTNGAGHSGEHNAWFAYQAVAEALDHNRDLWPTRAGCYRTASLLTGELASKKNAVLDTLVQFSMSA